MLATHVPKFSRSDLQQRAMAARIVGQIPPQYICSSTVKAEREFWAAPRNAADMREWRDMAGVRPPGAPFEPDLPPLEDLRGKQILLPLQNWREGKYICASPVGSMAVMSELFKRLADRPKISRLLQPVSAALSTHGETLLMQGGWVRMLRYPHGRPEPGQWTGEAVQIVVRLHGVNLSSAYFSTGIPSLSALGGAMHVLERELGPDLHFAYGLRDVSIQRGGKRSYKLKKATEPSPNPVLDEVFGSCTLVLLLRADRTLDLDQVRAATNKLRRIAGGSMIDVQVSRTIGADAEPARFVCKAALTPAPDQDILDAALDAYTAGWDLDEQTNRWTRNAAPAYSAVLAGYALLEEPAFREHGRGNYLHAWAEPLFLPVRLGPLSDDAWWTRTTSPSGTWWE